MVSGLFGEARLAASVTASWPELGRPIASEGFFLLISMLVCNRDKIKRVKSLI